MNQKQLTRIVLSLFFTGVVLSLSGGLPFLEPKLVQAVGDLTIDWGVPEGDPIFVLENMAPGESHSRTITVTNRAKVTRFVGIRGRITQETGDLKKAISVTISQGNADIYGGNSNTGPQTLKQFFEESATPIGIPLTLLPGKESTSYTIVAHFLPESGNPYQDTRVTFNLLLGLTAQVPKECKMSLDVYRVLYGTEKNDRIKGTPGNDLIFALEGNDRVEGGGGDDCIVGNEGNDQINGGPGDDVIFGNLGNDKLDGSINDDTIFGQEGNDSLYGKHGDDHIYGGAGNDNIRGGDHDDTLFGEAGNDNIWGERGNDKISGGEGNDGIKGGDNEDNLIGNEGFDVLNGEKGKDRCDGEVEINCEI